MAFKGKAGVHKRIFVNKISWYMAAMFVFITFIFFNFQNEYSGSGFSKIDPNKINLLEYPNVAKVPWTYATLMPGDCIYIPAGIAYSQIILISQT